MKNFQVHTTKDYSLFKDITGNRTKNTLHIDRLKKSMEEQYLFTVITVNEKYQIIDGQHRFECIKELGLPLYYVICEGYGLDEVQRMNINSKNWGNKDYLQGYCDMGKEDYIVFRDFKNKYDFSHPITLALLTGTNDGGFRQNQFKRGDLKIKDINNAHLIAKYIEAFGKFYEGYKRRSFCMAIITLCKNKKFKIMELINKVERFPSRLVDCTTTANYIKLLEEIYNYKRRNKVNLRY